jgi:hypothetical protein
LNKLAHNRNDIGRLLYLFFGRLITHHGLSSFPAAQKIRCFGEDGKQIKQRTNSLDHKNARRNYFTVQAVSTNMRFFFSPMIHQGSSFQIDGYPRSAEMEVWRQLKFQTISGPAFRSTTFWQFH